MNTNFNELALSITEKAVTDYKLLLELNVKEIEFCDEGRISKVELEDFFRSEWCDFLLCNMRLTGEDILSYLDRE